MPRFIAEVSFRFEAESLETAGAEIRRLQQVAVAAGFELERGRVTDAPPDDEGGWTSYAG
jgi:hypothetical protein